MSILKKVSLSCVAVLLFFVCAELILRLSYHPKTAFWFDAPHSQSIMQADPDLGYRLRPNFTGQAYASLIRTNGLGFRGRNFDGNQKRGKRIVALGDSVTFGFGASSDEHTYPAELEALLRATDGDTEVINAGVIGYNSLQALLSFRRDIVRFNPDIVLVFIGWNDMGNSLSPNWNPAMKQKVEKQSWISGPPFVVLALSELLQDLRPAPRLGFKPEAINVYSDNLHKIIDAARANGIDPVVLTWPTRVADEIEKIGSTEIIPGTGVSYTAWFSYYLMYQAELEKTTRTEKVHKIGLAESFAREADANLYYDQIHLSDEGNRKAARVIYEAIRQQIPARRAFK